MGWFGNGKYDGDGTASTQIAMIEAVGYEKNIPLKNKKETIEEAYHWVVGKELLADEVVIKVFKSWNKIEKNVIKNFNKEPSSLNYMMAADFFINHKAIFPEGLKDKTLEALDYLMAEHCEDFNNPAARRKVLKNFKEKVESYPEFSIVQPTIKKSVELNDKTTVELNDKKNILTSNISTNTENENTVVHVIEKIPKEEIEKKFWENQSGSFIKYDKLNSKAKILKQLKKDKKFYFEIAYFNDGFDKEYVLDYMEALLDDKDLISYYYGVFVPNDFFQKEIQSELEEYAEYPNISEEMKETEMKNYAFYFNSIFRAYAGISSMASFYDCKTSVYKNKKKIEESSSTDFLNKNLLVEENYWKEKNWNSKLDLSPFYKNLNNLNLDEAKKLWNEKVSSLKPNATKKLKN